MEKHREMQLGRNGRQTAMRKDHPSKELPMPKSVLPPVPSGTHAKAEPHPMLCDLHFRSCGDDDAQNALDLYDGDDIADAERTLNSRYGKATRSKSKKDKPSRAVPKGKSKALTSLPAPSNRPPYKALQHDDRNPGEDGDEDDASSSASKSNKDDLFSTAHMEAAPVPPAFGGYEETDGIGSSAAKYEELDFEELLKNRKEHRDEESEDENVFDDVSVGERKAYGPDGKEIIREGKEEEKDDDGWFGTDDDEEDDDRMKLRAERQRARRGRDFTGKRVRNSQKILDKGAESDDDTYESEGETDGRDYGRDEEEESILRGTGKKGDDAFAMGSSTIFRGFSMPHIIEVALYIITGIVLIFVMEQFVQLGVQIGKASAQSSMGTL